MYCYSRIVTQAASIGYYRLLSKGNHLSYNQYPPQTGLLHIIVSDVRRLSRQEAQRAQDDKDACVSPPTTRSTIVEWITEITGLHHFLISKTHSTPLPPLFSAVYACAVHSMQIYLQSATLLPPEQQKKYKIMMQVYAENVYQLIITGKFYRMLQAFFRNDVHEVEINKLGYRRIARELTLGEPSLYAPRNVPQGCIHSHQAYINITAKGAAGYAHLYVCDNFPYWFLRHACRALSQPRTP